jgi:Ca-activated chloride channel homolog
MIACALLKVALICAAGAVINPIDAVFLFTDGLANCGVTSDSQLAGLMTSALKDHRAATGRSVKVHTFGFGIDHNPQTLQAISEAAGGEYFFINSEADISTAFATALGGLLSVSVQNLEITVSPAAGVEVLSVQTHFKTTRMADGTDRWAADPASACYLR